LYGATQSHPERIQELRRLGCRYRFIANLQKCSFSSVSQFSALKSPMAKISRPKKITAEVSSYIDTLPSLDSTLTNAEIARRSFQNGSLKSFGTLLFNHESPSE
jgi:hypothetical protein